MSVEQGGAGGDGSKLAGIPERLRLFASFANRYDLAGGAIPESTGWTLLGSGEYAHVGRVYCKPRREWVILKVFKEPIPQERQARASEEYLLAKAVARRCPNVFLWENCFFEPEGAWFEGEDTVGLNLRQILTRQNRRPLPFAQARKLATEMLQGIVAAHSAGVVHRDIKPENLLIPDGGGPLKILDFGLAKAGEEVARTLTKAGATPQYMPPEAWEGQAVGPPGDVWGACLVLFEIFTGYFPWNIDERTSNVHFYSFATGKAGPPTSPWHYVRNFPEALGETIMNGLKVPPAKRPTAQRILDVLAATPADPALWAAAPVGPRSQRRRRRLVLALTLGPVLAALGLLAYVATRPMPAPVLPPPTLAPTPKAPEGLAQDAAGTIPQPTPATTPPTTPSPTAPATVARTQALPSVAPATPPQAPAPTAAPHIAAFFEGGAIILANVGSDAVDQVVVTVADTEHRCALTRGLGPNHSRLLPPACWAPPLGTLVPEKILVVGQTPGGTFREIIAVQPSPR